jgi:superfamily II DNA helicase RecQ
VRRCSIVMTMCSLGDRQLSTATTASLSSVPKYSCATAATLSAFGTSARSFAAFCTFVFDKAHCILLWESFHNSYRLHSQLHLLTPDHIPIYAPTATATPSALNAIKTLLQLRESNTVKILHSNDCADLHIAVCFMQHPAYMFQDLAFLIPNLESTTTSPPCFLVFCSSQETTEEVCLTLKAMVLFMKGKIAWFHSDITPECRAEMVDKLRSHELWGVFCTDTSRLIRTRFSIHLDI